MEKKIRKLSIKDFANLMKIAASDINPECRKMINEFDFRYRHLLKEEQDKIILQVLKRLDSDNFTTTGEKKRWDRGWSENLKSFIKSRYKLETLTPRYVRPNQPIRFFGRYVTPLDDKFELNWYKVFRHWLFSTYLKDASAIYEFGCGSGYNLPILANLFPEKELYGLDWVKASKDIISKMAAHYGWKMRGYLFDMFSPNEKLNIKKGSAILTMGGFEQLGDNFKKFLHFILRKNPSICVHMEPLIELYNPETLFDYLAIRFLQKRRYLGKFLESLKKLEEEKKLRIIKVQRVRLGSLYHEGYSFVIWQPLKN